MNTPLRTIHIKKDPNAGDQTARVQAYLYSNFSIAGETDSFVIVNGYDKAGWTAESLLDRLASGLIFGKVVR